MKTYYITLKINIDDNFSLLFYSDPSYTFHQYINIKQLKANVIKRERERENKYCTL